MTTSLTFTATLLFAMSIFSSSLFSQPTPFNYTKAWDEVKKAEEKGLPETALKTVNQIYQQAKADKNEGQVIKALIHQLKFASEKEDDILPTNIEKVENELLGSSESAKPILHSILGEMYWRYYQNNRWRFRDRTQTSNFQQEDIATWSLENLVETTVRHYITSYQLQAYLKKTELSTTHFDVLLQKGNKKGQSLRPTLFDFLAHRALDFFKNEEPDIIQPTYAFTLNQEAFLSDASTFSSLKIENKDSLSTKFHALSLLQSLTQFHLSDKVPDALVEIDLERLEFVKRYTTLPNKDSLYLNALENLEKKVLNEPVSTLVTYKIANEYVQKAGEYQPLQPETQEKKWKAKEGYALCETAKKRFPDSEGAIKCENLQQQILTKSLNVEIEEVQIPNTPFKTLVKYKNFTELYWRAIKISREEVKEQRKKYERNYNVDREEKFLEYFLGKPVTKTGNATLPNDGDHQNHSVEVKLEGLPTGEYMILFSNKPDFNLASNGLGYAFTTVSTMSFIYRRLPDGSNETYVLDRKTGEPLANVKVQVLHQRYDSQIGGYKMEKGNSYVTNTEGSIKLPIQNPNDQSSICLEFSLGSDRLSSTKIEDSYCTIGQYVPNDRQAQEHTYFFLDRGIYRPGQTIYFKGLLTLTDGKKSSILPKRSIKVVLRDVNYQEVAQQSFVTNEFGTFNGVFTAPNTGLLGEMRLECLDVGGQVAFSVEEYKRPKFEVKFEPIKGTFRLEDSIQTTGLAQAYSGANIDGANVSYRVVRIARFPFWWWCKWGFYPTSPEMEITNGVTTTDANGKFHIPFVALPDQTVNKASDPIFTYTVYADVTDLNGETHSGQNSISIGYKALQVAVDVTNMDLASETATSRKWHITTANQAGEFESAKGNIVVHKLLHPNKALKTRLWAQPDKFILSPEDHATLFPYDVYADENNDLKWQKGNQVFQLSFDTQKETTFAFSNLKSWETGKYLLEITSKDKYGQEVRELDYFELNDSKAKTLALPAFNYAQLLTSTVEPNGKALILVGSSAHVRALFEIEKGGQVIKKEWITLKNQQKTIEIPIKEEDRGGINIHCIFVVENRLYDNQFTVQVPYSNKDLDIQFETFRDKLQPGQKEEWKIKVKGKTADKVAAEMVATLYDASLDVFRTNQWSTYFWGSSFSQMNWEHPFGFGSSNSREYIKNWNVYSHKTSSIADYDKLNWFGYHFYGYGGRRMMKKGGANIMYDMQPMASPSAANMREEEVLEEAAFSNQTASSSLKTALESAAPISIPKEGSSPQIRQNFNETAFFYPNLHTNENGELVIAFTLPDALTRWKMMGFAHTKDLQSGMVQKELVAQKDLMVVPNQPRFFREGDKMSFSTKITSLTEAALKGTATLEFTDALTGKTVSNQLLSHVELQTLHFELKPKSSTNLEWEIKIPEGIQALSYRIVAQAGQFSDGEEMTLPVVTNRTLVTETLPLPIRGKQTKTFTFNKLKNATSNTLKHHRYTLEFTSNPAWYAVQALPYLMEYPYECVEQTFSRYYANTLASHIANSNPKIKQVFETWKNIQPNALLSNLEKNQELKSALLEETPWVMEAKDETQRKRNVGLLFDLNRMANEQTRALEKIQKAQLSSGGFSWFPGMPEDRYMTQHIVAGLGHLKTLGIQENAEQKQITDNALRYLDNELKRDYEQLKAAAKRKEIKLEEYQPDYSDIHFLYARSYFKETPLDKPNKEAFDYFLNQTKKYWLRGNIYLEGMTALTLHRYDQKAVTTLIINSLKEKALHSEELGMYYKQISGFYWYQAPIETQALLIEVFDEVANDQKSVEDLKVWLLKQKQTQDWKTTKATSEACYALLRRGTDVLATTEIPEITVGGSPLGKVEGLEAGTGYFKTTWNAEQITSKMADITITKKDEGVAWGSVYWQYFEQLDKITTAETPLKLKKQLFLQQNTDRGPVISPITAQTDVKVGDVVKVRIELRTDRNMEYVHLKDMRAAGLEPIATLSESKYQDGLWYYESPRDLNTSFFMGYLPKGTYVFEYALRVSQKGDFSNGISTIQCMYAPEFSSHSEGIRVLVK